MPGVQFTFTSGTNQLGGSVTVTNTNTNQKGFRSLSPNSTAASCAAELSFAAGGAGYQATSFNGDCTITGTGITTSIVGAFVQSHEFSVAIPKQFVKPLMITGFTYHVGDKEYKATLPSPEELTEAKLPEFCTCGDTEEPCIDGKKWRCQAAGGGACKWFKTSEVCINQNLIQPLVPPMPPQCTSGNACGVVTLTWTGQNFLVKNNSNQRVSVTLDNGFTGKETVPLEANEQKTAWMTGVGSYTAEYF